MTSRDARIDRLMRLYEHGELSHDELSEQIIIQDELPTEPGELNPYEQAQEKPR